jgi:hypothetical protein
MKACLAPPPTKNGERQGTEPKGRVTPEMEIPEAEVHITIDIWKCAYTNSSVWYINVTIWPLVLSWTLTL